MSKQVKTIKATPNHNARTFTIRVYWDGKLSSKYRTTRMSQEDMRSMVTQNDWQQFLNSCNSDYYSI